MRCDIRIRQTVIVTKERVMYTPWLKAGRNTMHLPSSLQRTPCRRCNRYFYSRGLERTHGPYKEVRERQMRHGRSTIVHVMCQDQLLSLIS
jgi:RNase P subunit RPR2